MVGLNFPSLTGGEQPAGGRVAISSGSGEPAVGRSEASQETPQLVVSESLPVVPGKLVRKILQGEFVEMAELQKDNMEVERRRAAAGEAGQATRVNRREVPDFDTWLQCFSMYAVVICSKYPGKAKDLWAYQAFMVTEYRKCGGRGWLIYDSLFRQQLPSIEAAEFGRINQSLYSTTFLAHRGRTGQFCYRCSSSDHSQEECALHPNRGLQMVQVHSGPVQVHSGSSPRDKDRGTEAEERAPRSLLRV